MMRPRPPAAQYASGPPDRGVLQPRNAHMHSMDACTQTPSSILTLWRQPRNNLTKPMEATDSHEGTPASEFLRSSPMTRLRAVTKWPTPRTVAARNGWNCRAKYPPGTRSARPRADPRCPPIPPPLCRTSVLECMLQAPVWWPAARLRPKSLPTSGSGCQQGLTSC